MIDRLKSAANQLHTAWDNYYRVYSTIQDYGTQKSVPAVGGFLPELANQLNTELDFISSIEPKVREIKVAISRVRNYSSGLTPINTLPPEILTRIFHLVLAQPCNLEQLTNSRESHYPRHQDYLAQVCVLWRKTALSSCSLWHHIDLPGKETSHDETIARAITYVERAGELPLELHIIDQESHLGRREDDGLYWLIKRIAHRVETLEFTISSDSSFHRFHSDIFDGFFLGRPKMLTRLCVRSNKNDAFFYSVPNYFKGMDEEDQRDADDVFLKSNEDTIESAFAGLKVLHLHGIFPDWSSKAYCGLVDLRLLTGHGLSHIEEENLIAILESSPALRIIHFGLEITRQTPSIREIYRVQLHELEVIKICFPESDINGLPCILRLLSPGARPIRLSLQLGNYYDTSFMMEVEQFLSRSLVASFYIRKHIPPMSLLVLHAAHLEHVVLDSFVGRCAEEADPSTRLQVDVPGLAPMHYLKSLHITRSRLTETQLRLFVDLCPTGVVLDSCNIGPNDYVQEALLDSFPTVRTTERAIYPPENPTSDWDILN